MNNDLKQYLSSYRPSFSHRNSSESSLLKPTFGHSILIEPSRNTTHLHNNSSGFEGHSPNKVQDEARILNESLNSLSSVISKHSRIQRSQDSQRSFDQSP